MTYLMSPLLNSRNEQLQSQISYTFVLNRSGNGSRKPLSCASAPQLLSYLNCNSTVHLYPPETIPFPVYGGQPRERNWREDNFDKPQGFPYNSRHGPILNSHSPTPHYTPDCNQSLGRYLTRISSFSPPLCLSTPSPSTPVLLRMQQTSTQPHRNENEVPRLRDRPRCRRRPGHRPHPRQLGGRDRRQDHLREVLRALVRALQEAQA